MSVTSALVLFAVIWFMVLFITLPLRLKTQGEAGKIVPGTHSGAPANLNLKRLFTIVTAVSVVVWAVIGGIIISGAITVADLDFFNRLRPGGETGG